MRWPVLVAVLAGLGWCQAPPPKYIVKLTATLFQVSLPANGANPASHCNLWVRQGGLYDAEVACYVGSVFTGRMDTAPAGEGFDGAYRAPGGGWIRWLMCNAIALGCGRGAPKPTSPGQLMYLELSAQLGDGSPPQSYTGYY